MRASDGRLAVIVLFLGLALPSPAHAQRHFTLSAGLGGASVPVIGATVANLFVDLFTGGGYDTKNTRTTGARALTLSTGQGSTRFGLTAINERVDSDIYLEDADPTSDGTQRITSTALMLEVTRYHGATSSFYSSLALGGALLHQDLTIEGDRSEDSQVAAAFQLDLLGLSVGRQLRGWGALGFGYRGILSAGASYRF